MPKAIALFLCLILCWISIIPATSAQSLGELSIMTYNAEFLWDGREPEEGISSIQFPWKDKPAAADAHMQAIANVILRNNPDIVNLVEVENFQTLKYFNNKFVSDQRYQPYLVKGKDTITGQDVALLSRIAPEIIDRDNRKGKSGKVTKSVSKNYYAKFEINGQKLALIGIHFLANPTSKGRKNQRQAQADAMRQLALDLRQDGYLPIIWGDFNDFDGEVKDRSNSKPLTNVLSQLKTLGTKTENDDLINVLEFLGKRDRYTNFYDRNRNNKIEAKSEYSAIDFILVAQELEDNIAAVAIDHDYDPRKVSDHFPIIVTLTSLGN
ncbi:MAG: endonuclease/exonuclease/phosphatase family protein [Cyanobacteria bacterium P01_F01_bin.143]